MSDHNLPDVDEEEVFLGLPDVTRGRKTAVLKTAIRRQFILKLRATRSNLTWDETSEIARRYFNDKYGPEWLPAGYDAQAACIDFQRELDTMGKQRGEIASRVFATTLANLEELKDRLLPAAFSLDYQAIDRLLKVVDRLHRMTGIGNERHEQGDVEIVVKFESPLTSTMIGAQDSIEGHFTHKGESDD